MYNRNVWKNSTCRKILFLTEIAKQGNIEAQFELGMSYLKGEGVPRSAIKAAKWLYKAAIQGNMEAQFELGILYLKGEGVKRSTALATKWLYEAAAQGHREAQDTLIKNYVHKTAIQGNMETQFELGMSYLKGEGVTRSAVKAARWLYKSAVQGNMEAQFELGILYLKGEGVKRSTALATKWFCKAAVQGHREAQDTLIENYSENYVQNHVYPDLFEKAVEYVNKNEKETFPLKSSDIADFKSHTDQLNFANRLFMRGMEFYQEQQVDKAIPLLRRAAQLGLEKSQLQLMKIENNIGDV